MFTFEFDHFDWLSLFYIEWRQTAKLVTLKISAKVVIFGFVKVWKWLKLLDSVSFIKKTIVNHVYIWIWSSWQNFTVLHSNLVILTEFHSFTMIEDKLQNSSILRFLQRSLYASLFKTWKWLKLLNSVSFINKTLVSYGYLWISSFWLTFKVLQWVKTTFKISQFEDSC